MVSSAAGCAASVSSSGVSDASVDVGAGEVVDGSDGSAELVGADVLGDVGGLVGVGCAGVVGAAGVTLGTTGAAGTGAVGGGGATLDRVRAGVWFRAVLEVGNDDGSAALACGAGGTSAGKIPPIGIVGFTGPAARLTPINAR